MRAAVNVEGIQTRWESTRFGVRSLLTKVGKAPERIYGHVRGLGLGSKPTFVRTADGFVMWIDPHDFMDRQFLVGLYEPEVLALARKVLRSGDTCIDIGAHTGYFTLHMARLVGSSGQVIAFEPDPVMMELLRAHCERNAFTQVRCDMRCVGECEGVVDLELSRPGWSTRFPNAASVTDIRGHVRVERTFLDEEPLTHHAPPRFIKIDAEGSEPEILQGARRLLGEHKATLCVEINHSALHSANADADDVQTKLEQMGYRLYVPSVSRRSWVPLGNSRLKSITNPAFNVAAIHLTHADCNVT